VFYFVTTVLPNCNFSKTELPGLSMGMSFLWESQGITIYTSQQMCLQKGSGTAVLESNKRGAMTCLNMP